MSNHEFLYEADTLFNSQNSSMIASVDTFKQFLKQQTIEYNVGNLDGKF